VSARRACTTQQKQPSRTQSQQAAAKVRACSAFPVRVAKRRGGSDSFAARVAATAWHESFCWLTCETAQIGAMPESLTHNNLRPCPEQYCQRCCTLSWQHRTRAECRQFLGARKCTPVSCTVRTVIIPPTSGCSRADVPSSGQSRPGRHARRSGDLGGALTFSARQ
jgi:hypothetical protein